MQFKDELAEAMRLKVMVVLSNRMGDPVHLSVWSDDTRVNFHPAKEITSDDTVRVYVYSMNTEEKAYPYRVDTYLGIHFRHKIGKLIRILGACSPRYMSYALRHAGIMEHEECGSCQAHHAPAANHTFWRDIL